jgi:hypothetical protein
MLDGDVVLTFGYAPTIGDSFIVVATGAGTISGMFDAILAPAGTVVIPTYGLHGVTLTVAAVPEPESYAFMLTGLLIVAAAARRRRARGVDTGSEPVAPAP